MGIVIQKFRGKYSFLSNFYACSIVFKGKTYPSAEHLFQALKTMSGNQRASIRRATSPQKAKYLGRQVQLRLDWEEIKDDMMYKVLSLKFTQNYQLQVLLKETGECHLEEGNNWHDNYWGNCYCQTCSDIKGWNALGKTLMKLRTQLLM